MFELKANSFGSSTLVAYLDHNPNELTVTHGGNCFSVWANNRLSYQIVNIKFEPLKKLMRFGVVAFPIKIKHIGKNRAIIIDERIPQEWLNKRYCSICCPQDLMPEEQQRRIETVYRRKKALGLIIDAGNGLFVEKSFESKYAKKEREKNGGYIYAPMIYCVERFKSLSRNRY